MKLWKACLFSLVATAAQAQTIELINHFGEDIAVTVTQGGDFLPGFETQFTIPSGATSATTVLRSGRECETKPFNPSAYLMVSGVISPEVSAFLGVGLMCDSDAVEVSGFISHNIAFRWNLGDQAKVTFCKMEDYPC